MMKSRLLLITGVLIGLLFLAACQSGNNPVEDEEYPAPLIEEIATATARPTVLPGQAMYPEIENNTNINWFQAEAMILNGEVAKVVLLQDLNFQLMLKDGRLLNSIQPGADSIPQTIEACGDLCSATEVVQE
jgi:hypothetical protein